VEAAMVLEEEEEKLLGRKGEKVLNDGCDEDTDEVVEEFHVKQGALGTFLVKWRTWIIAICFLGIQVVNSVFRVKMYQAWGTEYTFFRQQLTNFLYNVDASIVVIYLLIFTDEITPEMRRFPIWKLAVLGFFDGFSDFLSSVGGIGTPGSVQTVLNQTLIFYTMVFAIILLGSRFAPIQYAGGLAVMLGAALTIVPAITNNDTTDDMSTGSVMRGLGQPEETWAEVTSCLDGVDDASEGFASSVSIHWYSILIYAASILPQAASYTFKEMTFKKFLLNVFYVSCIVSWTQLALVWVFLPIQSLKGFGNVPLSTIPSQFKEGIQCFFGNQDVIVYQNQSPLACCSAHVPVVTMIYSITGFTGGILQLFIMKYGSATLAVVLNALTLPLAQLAFSLEFVMGDEREPFTFWSIGGLVLVVAGCLVYNLFSAELQRDREHRDRVEGTAPKADATLEKVDYEDSRPRWLWHLCVTPCPQPSALSSLSDNDSPPSSSDDELA